MSKNDLSGYNQNGRDLGLEFVGSAFKKEGFSLLNYELAIFNGHTLNANDNNESKDIVGRLIVNPIKELSVAGYFQWGEGALPGYNEATRKFAAQDTNLQLADMFGNPPRTIMNDKTVKEQYADLKYDTAKVADYLEQVLQLESVACKDWLTNKVDRSVTGKVAMQQCAGPLHLPLNDCGVVALDYQGKYGVATSVGHAPLCAMINPAKGSRMAVAEALTNIVWAPIQDNQPLCNEPFYRRGPAQCGRRGGRSSASSAQHSPCRRSDISASLRASLYPSER